MRTYISRETAGRVLKDSRVQENLGRYLDEIERVRADPFNRPQERLGDFHVSPRGWNGAAIRVAWVVRKVGGESSLLVAELLYEHDNEYCGNWNRRAAFGDISFRDYEPFVPLVPDDLRN